MPIDLPTRSGLNSYPSEFVVRVAPGTICPPARARPLGPPFGERPTHIPLAPGAEESVEDHQETGCSRSGDMDFVNFLTGLSVNLENLRPERPRHELDGIWIRHANPHSEVPRSLAGRTHAAFRYPEAGQVPDVRGAERNPRSCCRRGVGAAREHRLSGRCGGESASCQRCGPQGLPAAPSPILRLTKPATFPA